MAPITSSWVRASDRSQNQAPPAQSPRPSQAQWRTRRVLPMPPGPVTVTSAPGVSRAFRSATAAARPTKSPASATRLPRRSGAAVTDSTSAPATYAKTCSALEGRSSGRVAMSAITRASSRGGSVGSRVSRLGQRPVELVSIDARQILIGERLLPGARLVEHHAQGVQVGARVQGVPASQELLRRGIPDGAHERPGLRQAERGIHDPSQPQVHHQRSSARQQDVRRLEVAVDHPQGVDGHQPFGHLTGQAQRVIGGQRPVVEALSQGEPLHQGGGEPRATSPGAGIQRAHHPGVVDAAAELDLPQEALDHLGIRGEVRVEQLERGPSGATLGGPHDTHAAAAEPVGHLPRTHLDARP